MTKSKVAVLFTKPSSIIEDYFKIIKSADLELFLNKDVETILKDNISWHYPFPGANTTPWQLESTILALKNSGFNKISCVQNKTVVINTFKGEDLNLYRPIFKQYNIPVYYNFKDDDIKWIPYKPKNQLLILDKIFPEGIKIPEYFIGKNIIHLPTVKCHIYTTTTGAMKNAFGGLLNTYRHYTHSWIHETLVDLLTIQQEIHTGIFAVMDGTTAGNGPGPRTMKPEIKDVILASADQVAIDAVAAKLMGFDPFSIKYIRLAHERKLGIGDIREIDVVGNEIENINWNFKVGKSMQRFLGWLSWYGPTKALQKLIFRTPIVYIPIMVSEINHDYIHWPLKEKRIFNYWRNSTHWGKLFQRYEKEGYISRS